MEFIICDRGQEECNLLAAYVRDYYRNIEAQVHIRCCADWQGLSRQIREKKADAVIIAQNGTEGLDIVTGLKLNSGKIIWFSDLDFAVQAYRLCIAYFSMKPITQEKVINVLDHLTV